MILQCQPVISDFIGSARAEISLGLQELVVKVLLVKDSMSDARVLSRALEEQEPGGVELVHVRRVSDALKRLQYEACDVVLIDPGAPDARGLEAMRRVQESMDDLPVVVLNGYHAEGPGSAPSDGAGGLHQSHGDGALLMEALRRAIERKRAERRAEYLAYHDALTNLPNRRLLLDRLGQAILRAQRGNKRVALLFLDLNEFKTINDTLGHAVGDQLLVSVADRLTKRIRASDTLARQGGDEFTLVLPEIARALEARRLASKLQDALKAPFVMGEREVQVSVSVGVSLYPDHGKTPEELLGSADEAMYRAKHDRGRVCQVGPSRAPLAPAREQREFGNESRSADRPGDSAMLRQSQEAPSSRIMVDVARASARGREESPIDHCQDLRSQVQRILAELQCRAGAGGKDASAYLRMADRLVKALEKCGRATREPDASCAIVPNSRMRARSRSMARNKAGCA